MDAVCPWFTGFYERNYPVIRRFMVRAVGESDADDLTDEVFVKLYRAYCGRPDGEAVAEQAKWETARNVVRSHFRRRARRPQEVALNESIDLEDDDTSPEELAVLAERREHLSACVAALPLEQRVCVLLRMAGLSQNEIAEILRTTRDVVRTRLARADASLKACLAERGMSPSL